jgi:hypothetical protein
MASAPEAVARFEREKLFTASSALIARRLREHGGSDFWPASPKGGGSHAPQVQPQHLVAFLLALATDYTPIDAAKTVRAVWDLTMSLREVLVQVEPARGRGPRIPPKFLALGDRGPLGPMLVHVVRCVADDPQLRVQATGVMESVQWTLTLCPDPPYAAVSWRIGKRIWIEHFGERPTHNRSHRLITLPYKAFMVAGELWADSAARMAAPAQAAA